MKCPACKHVMVVMEYRGIELDYCAECMGVWFDRGELELLMETSGLNPAETPLRFESALEMTREALRRCPLCRKKMEKVTPAGAGGKVIVDRCAKGCGLWFDADEVCRALAFLPGKEEEKKEGLRLLAGFLKETLTERKA